MAVISVAEHYEGRQGDIALEGVRNYSRTFNVRTNSVADSGPTIFNAAGVPALWAVHPDDSWARCIKKSCRQGEDPTWWQVNVDYSTKLPIDPDEANENPLLRPMKFRISTNTLTKIIEEDQTGAEILNSARQFFEGGYEAPDSRPVINISWNHDAATFSMFTLTGAVNKVNDDMWNSFTAGELLVVDVSAEGPQLENDVLFWQCTASLEYNFDGWNPVRVLDQGYMYRDDDGDLQPIPDAQGHPVTQQALLDGDGGILDSGGTPVYREFTIYAEVDFDNVFPS